MILSFIRIHWEKKRFFTLFAISSFALFVVFEITQDKRAKYEIKRNSLQKLIFLHLHFSRWEMKCISQFFFFLLFYSNCFYCVWKKENENFFMRLWMMLHNFWNYVSLFHSSCVPLNVALWDLSEHNFLGVGKGCMLSVDWGESFSLQRSTFIVLRLLNGL
jgi:hypothetical protein